MNSCPSLIEWSLSATLSIVNVGQGDCIVLHDRTVGDAILIDCPSGKGNTAVEFLKAHSIQKLRAVVVSHLHADHYGGIEEALDRLIPAPEELWLSVAFAEGQGSRPAGRAVLSLLSRIARKREIRRSIPVTGKVLSCGRMRLDVLAPNEEAQLRAVERADPNWSSLIVSAELAGFRALLGADAPPAQWANLIAEKADLRADVLLVPHHGAGFPGQDLHALLDAVRPSVIGLSAGSANPYDHPRAGTLDILGRYATRNNARLLCTQLNRHCAGRAVPADTVCAGTISVELGPSSLRVQTGNAAHQALVVGQPSARCV